MTGLTFAHGTVADVTSPASLPAHLLARDTPAGPASSRAASASGRAASASGRDSALRSAIVSVARHYLQMARTRTPAEMEALIWRADSTDGAGHGPSCAAFASLTLALGARAAGQQSWVTGGGSYPWPLRQWADVRVQPNPASPSVVSMLGDAQAHHRWHPLGDGYRPQPGDWVLFDGHVEVITRYADAAIDTVGGDSLPDLTVNAHTFPAPFGAQGVLGFVDNGDLADLADLADRRPAGAARGPGAPRRRCRECSRRRPGRPPRWRGWCRRATTDPRTAGTIRRRRACRARPPSRRSSAGWRRGRSRRGSGTASRPQ